MAKKKEKSTNLMSFNSEFKQLYFDRREAIINNMFLHIYTSPYDTTENHNLIKNIDIDSKKILELLENRDFILKLQHLEKIKMVNMYIQLLFAITNNNEVTEDQILIEAKRYNSLSTFNSMIKELNYVYHLYLYNTIIGSDLLGTDGRIQWDKIQKSMGGSHFIKINRKGEENIIRELSEDEQKWFNDWYNVFDPNQASSLVTLNKKRIDLSNKNIEDISEKFKEYQEALQKKIEEEEKKGDYAKAEMLSIIQNYTLGRGLNLINQMFKNNKQQLDFNKAKEILINKTNSLELQNKINMASQPKNIHYKYKDIRGSFTHSIDVSNYRGFVAEKLLEKAFKNIIIKIGSKSYIWQSERVGSETNESGKMQKIDNYFSIPQLVTIDKKTNEIKLNPKINNNIKINLSLKDYRDAAINIHSGGNLESIISYLEQNINNVPEDDLIIAVKDYLVRLKTNEVKYALLNEGEPNRIDNSRKNSTGFFKRMSEGLANLGPVFALSKISAINDLNDDISADFLVINQTIIPGSMLFETIEKIVKYNVTISPNSYPTNPDYTPQEVNQSILYSDEVLQSTKNRNEKIFSQITFSFHLRREFKNELIKRISDIGGK